MKITDSTNWILYNLTLFVKVDSTQDNNDKGKNKDEQSQVDKMHSDIIAGWAQKPKEATLIKEISEDKKLEIENKNEKI